MKGIQIWSGVAADGSSAMNIVELCLHSQHGEDGVIASIFASIGYTNRFFVEIGCGDGSECNTRALEDASWSGLKFDKVCNSRSQSIFREFVTPHNINDLLYNHVCPVSPDLISIDIDSCDWHVLRALLQRYDPVVIVAEYNALLGADADMVVPVDCDAWDGSDYFGASYQAFLKLANYNGYTCAYIESTGTNMFFVRDDKCSWGDGNAAYRKPGYEPYPHDDKRRWHTSADYIGRVHKYDSPWKDLEW